MEMLSDRTLDCLEEDRRRLWQVLREPLQMLDAVETLLRVSGRLPPRGDGDGAAAVMEGEAEPAQPTAQLAPGKQRRERASNLDWLRGRAMWDADERVKDIAAALGCSVAAVRHRRERDGWLARPGGRPRKEKRRAGRPSELDWPRGRQMWDDKASMKEIAAALGCSESAVKTRIRREDWPRRSPPSPDYDWKKGRKMWDAEASVKEIAEALDCSVHAVRGRRRRDEWPVRSRGRRRTLPRSGLGLLPGRTTIALTKCPACKAMTTLQPCEMCHTEIAARAIGKT